MTLCVQFLSLLSGSHLSPLELSCAHIVEDSFPKMQQKLIFLNIIPDESSELRCILLRNMQSLVNASIEWAHYTEAMCPKSEVDKKSLTSLFFL